MFNPVKSKRERIGKDIRRVEAKEWERSQKKKTLILEGRERACC
jgi:hypothetical protein